MFRPLLEQAPRPGARRWFERFRLIDRGDHVEWRGRGKGPVRRWRLPDQPVGDYPALAAVVRIFYPHPVPAFAGSYRIVFVDERGTSLASIGAPLGRRAVPAGLAHAMFPDEAFRGLAARGVPLVQEEPVAEKEFLRRHPEPGLNILARWSRLYPRAAVVVPVVRIMLVITVALWLGWRYSG